MTKRNEDKLPRLNKNSQGSHRIDDFIPGTKIPRKFYLTVCIDLEFISRTGSLIKAEEVFKDELQPLKASALNKLRQYVSRYRVFECCGVDPGDDFKLDYTYSWCTTDDGVVQLLRLDMFPLSMRAIDTEIAFVEGELEEVWDEKAKAFLFKPAKKKSQ